jgi:NRPS condensation-like uncharacterized protein
MQSDRDKTGDQMTQAQNDMTNPGCIRKMSNLERAYYMHPGCNVAVVARITGRVSEPDLCRALATVSQVHPLTGAKIVSDEHHDVWFASGNVPDLPLRIAGRTSDTQWFFELQSELKKPFTLAKGPLIRFILLRSQEKSDLVVICSHSICDGVALANLVRDILEYYADPGKVVTVLPPPEIADYLPKARGFSFTTIIPQLFARYCNRLWRKSPHYFSQEDYESVTKAFWEDREFGVVEIGLGPEETAALTARCRKEGVTIGSAVMAACIAAREDCTGAFDKREKNVLVPFDLRRHATRPIGDVFCLCVGGAQFPFTYRSKIPFWANAVALHNVIHRKVNTLDSSGMGISAFDPSFIDAFACFAILKQMIPEGAFVRTKTLARFSEDTKNIAFTLARNAGNMIPGTIASNLGKLNLPETYGELKIDRLLFLTPASDKVPLVLGGVTLGGKLEYCLTYIVRKDDREASRSAEMIRIRNRALEYLGFPQKVHPGALE